MRVRIEALAIAALGLAIALPTNAQLVVNEVDYDQAGTDMAEFIELKNVSGLDQDLSAYKVQTVNGSGGGAAVANEFILPAVTLADGDYYVICGDAAFVANCDLDVDPDTNLIQNGAPDAVAVLLLDDTVVDTVSYEGDTGAPYTEGSGEGLVDDSGVDDSGISRCDDGVDTDMNNLDFIFTASTPGMTNSCDVMGDEFTLEVTGDCPGEVTIAATNGNAMATAALLLGTGIGTDALPGGPCVGTESGLALFGLATVVTLDGDGAFSLTRTVDAGACNFTLQMLDASDCSLSNTAPLGN